MSTKPTGTLLPFTAAKMAAKPFTPPQRAMLARLRAADGMYELCPSGNRLAAQASSAWWRVARNLIARGCCRRLGDGVDLTALGLKTAVAQSKE